MVQWRWTVLVVAVIYWVVSVAAAGWRQGPWRRNSQGAVHSGLEAEAQAIFEELIGAVGVAEALV